MSETVTLSFSDGSASGMASSAGLAVLFAGREMQSLASGSELDLSLREHAPLEAWSVRWEGADGGFEGEVSAVSAPVPVDGGSVQLVRVVGSGVDALGQLSRTASDLGDAALVRYVGAWMADGEGIVLQSSRPAKAGGHGDEAVWAALVERGDGVAVFDPRLSTTYDSDGRQRRAGLELWTTEEEGYPVRASGEVFCGSSLDLDDLVLDLSFVRWTSGGQEGFGRYDILRKRS